MGRKAEIQLQSPPPHPGSVDPWANHFMLAVIWEWLTMVSSSFHKGQVRKHQEGKPGWQEALREAGEGSRALPGGDIGKAAVSLRKVKDCLDNRGPGEISHSPSPLTGWAGVRGTWLEETAQCVWCVCVPSSSCLLWRPKDSHVVSGIFDQKGMVIFFSEERLEAG